ncbi:MAG: excinuclease ABC subunit UvrC [Cytophagales bacterium]
MESDTSMVQAIKATIQTLPVNPGIYKYFNKESELIYVGKAKNIKKRVSSYFSKIHTDNKTRSLVRQIHKIEFIVVNSEADALLLENNLIKTYQPKYNILLRDDKTYPYIILTKDRFPKIFATRKLEKEKGEHFGPFANVAAMYTVLNLIKKLFTIRNCDLNLSENNIKKQKFKKCLEYHLGNCKAPCEALQTESDYIADIEQVKLILNGDLSIVKKYFTAQMKQFSVSLDFEKAQKSKWKLDILEKYQSSSMVFNTNLKNQYVITFHNYDRDCYINIIKIAFGRIVQSKTIEFQQLADETSEEIFTTAVVQLIDELDLKKQNIISNIKLELEELGIMMSVPKIGDKKMLIDLSLKNIEFYRNNNLAAKAKEEPDNRLLLQVQKDLNLTELPSHIECFDNSNIQGTTPVAAMVCFKNGKPSKKDWRHFNIKTVTGPNDFASMEEIIFRRYARLVAENQPLPNLIIIDGGKGQLASAIKSLQKLDLYGKIAIISVAKRLEEIFTPNDELPLLLSKKSETLRFLQIIRDEVHRFGITFHRSKRDKVPKVKNGTK